MERLESQRLILRKLNINDLDDMYEWTSDDEVAKYVTWDAHKNKEETKYFLNSIIGKYENPDTYIYGIEEKSIGKLIGMIDVVKSENKTAEIGYVSNRSYWGKGYMTESLILFSQYILTKFKCVTIKALVENIASNRVIEKAGFEFIGHETTDKNKKVQDPTIKSYILKKGRAKDVQGNI